ncbi:MAG: hypothetical protein NTZ04_05670 [Chloroflexi bacterium]|nr:hypothetical protein [Chloroflexota bacterium]
MGTTIGQRIETVLVIILSPLLFALWMVVGLVVLIEAGALFFSWGLVVGLDKMGKKMGTQPHGC